MEAQALEAVKEHKQDEKTRSTSPFHHHPTDKHAVFKTLLQHDGLPAHEKLYNRISHEAVVLMAAGSETTASVLMMAIYFIVTGKQTILRRLREEVEGLMSSGVSRPSVADLERLPYLV